MSAKLRKALIKLAGFRGSNEEEFKELSGLSTGTIEASSHRALAVVGGSMVEEALRHAITRHLVPTRVAESGPILFEEENAPLTGLASRTRMAYALGIIGEEERSDLTFIRGIRNAFAHSTDRLSFEHETILASLDALHVLEKMPGEDDLKKIAGREFHAMRYAAAIAVHCGMLKLRRPYWEPAWNRSLAKALRKR